MSSPSNGNSMLSVQPWCLTGLREIVGFPGFRPDPEWIAGYLLPSVPPREIELALKNLLAMGLIKKNPKTNHFTQTNKNLTIATPKGKKVIDYHLAAIDLATASLDWNIAERSLFLSTAIAGDVVKINYFRSLALKLIKSILALEEQVKLPNQIYQFNLQLFALHQTDQASLTK